MMGPLKRSREVSLREMQDGDSPSKRGKGREHWTVADYRWDARLPSDNDHDREIFEHSDHQKILEHLDKKISEHPDYRVFKMAWAVDQTRIHFDKIEPYNELQIKQSKDLLSNLKLSITRGGYDLVKKEMELEAENNYFVQSIINDINRGARNTTIRGRNDMRIPASNDYREMRKMMLRVENNFDDLIKEDKEMLKFAKANFDHLSKAIEEVNIEQFKHVESIINMEKNKNRYLEGGLKLTEKHFFHGEITEEALPSSETDTNQQTNAMDIDHEDHIKNISELNDSMDLDS